MTIALADVSSYVNNLEPFRANSCFGAYTSNVYSVYSYGQHFPMYSYDKTVGKWYGNTDKWSLTTTRHQTMCRPDNVDEWYGTDTMKKISWGGIVYAIEERMAA